MQLLFGEDSFDLPGHSETPQIRHPVEVSESRPDSNSDDGTPLTASSLTLPDTYIPDVVPPVDPGATETFTSLADNALGLVFPPFHMHVDQVGAVIAPTPQAESLRAAPSKYKDMGLRGCERPIQKHHAPRGYASHVTANEVLVTGCPQDTCLRDAMNNASDSEKMTTSREKAYSYGWTSKPRMDHGPDDWLISEESTDEPNKKLLRAPLMRPVALPSIEETGDTESEELLCSGQDIGWYTGPFGGVSKMDTPEPLSFTLPMLPVDKGLLSGKRLTPSALNE